MVPVTPSNDKLAPFDLTMDPDHLSPDFYLYRASHWSRIQSRDLGVNLFLNHFGPDEPPQILVPYSLSK